VLLVENQSTQLWQHTIIPCAEMRSEARDAYIQTMTETH
jgi:hypothetical protein